MTPSITAAMWTAGRALSEPRLSADGSTLAFVATGDGRSSVVVVDAGGGPEVVLTTDPPPRGGWGVFDWLPDGSGVVYVGEDGSLHVQPITGGPSRRLERTEGAAAPAVAPDGRSVACTIDGRHVAVLGLDPGGARPRRLSGVPDFCVDPAWSPDGAHVAWHQWDVPAMAWDDSSVVVAATGTGAGRGAGAGLPAPAAVPTPHPASVGQPRYSTRGELAWICDAAGWLNLWHQPAAGGPPAPLIEERREHGDPTWGDGQRSWAWSPDGARIAFTRNVEGFGELCILDVATQVVTLLDRGVFSGLSWAGRRLAALRSGARTPDQVVVYDGPDAHTGLPLPPPPAGRPTRTSLARGPDLGDASGLVEPEVVHWSGEEVAGLGAEVHGRLYRSGRPSGVSDGRADGPAPLIVWAHGGPTAQHRVAWNARAAYLLDRGWNLLQVDPRGSTGWGRAYMQALTGEWGRLDVDDTVAGIEAAARSGWGDPQRTVIMGGSSAGLTVLSVLARHPGLCAAGIDLYGVADVFRLYATTHRFEAHYCPALLGSLPAAAGTWRDRSPMTHAGQIVDPLLVLHGSADEVVVPAQSEDLVARLRGSRTPVELHVYDGEGHGWSRPETVADELARIDAFLTRHVLEGSRP